jgi:hypothetical protein
LLGNLLRFAIWLIAKSSAQKRTETPSIRQVFIKQMAVDQGRAGTHNSRTAFCICFHSVAQRCGR